MRYIKLYEAKNNLTSWEAREYLRNTPATEVIDGWQRVNDYHSHWINQHMQLYITPMSDNNQLYVQLNGANIQAKWDIKYKYQNYSEEVFYFKYINEIVPSVIETISKALKADTIINFLLKTYGKLLDSGYLILDINIKNKSYDITGIRREQNSGAIYIYYSYEWVNMKWVNAKILATLYDDLIDKYEDAESYMIGKEKGFIGN